MSNRRSELGEALGREGRRIGSQSLTINHYVAEKLGISQREWEAVDVLDAAGPLTAGELASLMRVSTGAVTGIVDRLEERGFVTRRRDPSDRRKVIVELRHEGLGPAGEVYEPMVQGMTELIAELDEDELEAVVAFMGRFNGMLWEIIQRCPSARPNPGARPAGGPNGI